MKKKVIIIAASLLTILVLISLLRKEKPSEYHFTFPENEPFDSYHIEEADGFFTIRHEGKEVSFSVPGDWEVARNDGDRVGEMKFTNPDYIEGDKFPESGCLVMHGITNFFRDYESEELRPDWIRTKTEWESSSEVEKTIIVSNIKAIKSLVYIDSEIGNLVSLEIPVEDTIVHFGMTYPLKDKEFCNSEFDKIIDSVVIK